MPTAPADPPRPGGGRIGLEAPPESKPEGDPMDEDVGYLVLMLWTRNGTAIRNETFESPPLKRRYLPWVKELFRRIAKDGIDRIPAAKIDAALERMAALSSPKPEDPAPK